MATLNCVRIGSRGTSISAVSEFKYARAREAHTRRDDRENVSDISLPRRLRQLHQAAHRKRLRPETSVSGPYTLIRQMSVGARYGATNRLQTSRSRVLRIIRSILITYPDSVKLTPRAGFLSERLPDPRTVIHTNPPLVSMLNQMNPVHTAHPFMLCSHLLLGLPIFLFI
jgi:hypothetical protein